MDTLRELEQEYLIGSIDTITDMCNNNATSDTPASTKRRISYSALSTFEHCPRQYQQKYVLKQRADSSTLALELGSLMGKRGCRCQSLPCV